MTHRPRKRFGQTFLVDQAVIQRIISTIHLKPDQHIVEIGPGKGALTALIADRVNRFDLIELDKDLVPHLASKFKRPGLNIYQADALKFDLKTLLDDERQIRLIGNLPYNISTPLLFHIIKYRSIVEDMHFMLQKEVVQRLTSDVNSSHYGRLGIMVQYYCKTDALFDVLPDSFQPKPKVTSSIIRIKPYQRLPFPCEDVAILADIVRDAFNMRRKTIRNSMKKIITTLELEQLEINPDLRPESVSIELFVKIANFIASKDCK